MRSREDQWRGVFEALARQSKIGDRLGRKTVLWVDGDGAREWNLDERPPAERRVIENNRWIDVLRTLAEASAKSDVAARAIWFVDDSSHPDKLGKDDRLPTDFHPKLRLPERHVTLIWHGHSEPSKDLETLFPANGRHRLLATGQTGMYHQLTTTVLRELEKQP